MAQKIERIEEELRDVRSRLLNGDWQLAANSVGGRLAKLKNLLAGPEDEEINRHCIVSAIACLQSYHRALIVEITEESTDLKRRACQLLDEKFLLEEMVRLVDEKSVRIGELIAHSAPCNRVSDLVKWLNHMFDCDIKIALAAAVSSFDTRDGNQAGPKIIENVDEMFATLEQAFRLRHILAHEAAETLTISRLSARGSVEAVSAWIEGMTSVLWATIYRDSPLTQLEMNMRAYEVVRADRSELAKMLRAARAYLETPEERTRFKRAHEAWSQAELLWVRFAYTEREGSMSRAVGGWERSALLKQRTEAIERWIESVRPR